MMHPEMEAKLKEHVKSNPQTEKTILDMYKTKRCFYGFLLLVVIIISGVWFIDNILFREHEKELKKVIEYGKVYDKKVKGWTYEKVMEYYK